MVWHGLKKQLNLDSEENPDLTVSFHICSEKAERKCIRCHTMSFFLYCNTISLQMRRLICRRLCRKLTSLPRVNPTSMLTSSSSTLVSTVLPRSHAVTGKMHSVLTRSDMAKPLLCHTRTRLRPWEIPTERNVGQRGISRKFNRAAVPWPPNETKRPAGIILRLEQRAISLETRNVKEAAVKVWKGIHCLQASSSLAKEKGPRTYPYTFWMRHSFREASRPCRFSSLDSFLSDRNRRASKWDWNKPIPLASPSVGTTEFIIAEEKIPRSTFTWEERTRLREIVLLERVLQGDS